MAIKNANDALLEKLAEGLDNTASLTKALLSEIRESESDFATIKTELNILRENVKGLSEIIREGNGTSSILTRMALIEQNIQNINKWLESHIDVHQNLKNDYSRLENEFKDIQNKLFALQVKIDDIKKKQDEEENKQKQEYAKEREIRHEKDKNQITINTERKSTILKILGAIGLTLIGTLSGWAANSCENLKPHPINNPTTTISAPAPIPMTPQPQLLLPPIPAPSAPVVDSGNSIHH